MQFIQTCNKGRHGGNKYNYNQPNIYMLGMLQFSCGDSFLIFPRKQNIFQIVNPQKNQLRNKANEIIYYNIMSLQELHNQPRDVTVLKESTNIK